MILSGFLKFLGVRVEVGSGVGVIRRSGGSFRGLFRGLWVGDEFLGGLFFGV